MSGFNYFEKLCSRLLESCPRIKTLTKQVYQHLNYHFFGEKDFNYSLDPKWDILTPYQWAGVAEPEKKEELFFGYYDKSPCSKNMKKAVFHKLRNDNKVDIVLFDKSTNTVTTLGSSSACNFQQGSMTQWLPKYENKIIFNDFKDEVLGSWIVDISSQDKDFIPWPIQSIHPDGDRALTLNYKKLDWLRPEYGYAGNCNNFSKEMSVNEDGIWLVDLTKGDAELILSLKDLLSVKQKTGIKESQKHKINHIMYSPSGNKCLFMHRWFYKNKKFSRLFVLDLKLKKINLLLDDDMVSHYSWRDEEEIIVYGRTKEIGDHYYLINLITGDRTTLGKGFLDKYGDGHPTFSPDRRYILTDTYPDRQRKRHLLLYDTYNETLTEIGAFFEPLKFNGANRCDLHPRWNRNGDQICIDSVFEGKRSSYFLDIV